MIRGSCRFSLENIFKSGQTSPSTAIRADDRDGLEHILRYMGRPPISAERLSEASDGRIVVKLKRAWSDSTTHIILTPQEFLERLTSMIPPPRKNMIRYHGCFAANFNLRDQIVPHPNEGISPETQEAAQSSGSRTCPRQAKRWAQLLARVFGVSVLECPRCQSQMQMISFITESKAIRDILGSMKMSTAPPEAAPARQTEQQVAFSWGA